MSDLLKMAAALRAAAAVLEGGEVIAAAAPAAPSIADKVRDFLANDTSDFEWRSAKAISDAIGHSEADVTNAVRNASGLQSRNSTRGLGLLIALI